jgi:integrase
VQRGTIVKRRGSWTLLYWDHQLRNGEKKRTKVSKKLARSDREYPTKASVRQLADKILAPLNRGQLQPEASLKVSQYIDDFYFPAIEKTWRPATVDIYRFVFDKLDGKLDIERRVILPAIENARLETVIDGKTVKNEPAVAWKGFHGFRRGWASVLLGMGFSPVLIAAILPHGDIGSTMSWYIKTDNADARDAMEKLEARYRRSDLKMGA